MNALLYPRTDSSATLKARMHAVRTHPIYNFMHTYYRYSAEELKLFTPGVNAPLDVLSPTDSVLLHPLFQHSVSSRASSSAVPPLAAPPASTVEYRFPKTLSPEGRYGWIQMAKARDVLKSAASLNPPNFGCFGLHEWAMLYKGAAPKQPGLGLRVSQSTIDAMVEGGVKCSHYDAFRFFHQDAKQFNAVSLVRETQASFEQAACIHATMDLFKWSYKIYPLCSSRLLRKTLELALRSRVIDMRASPYDCSAFEHCSTPIAVETPEGRKEYAQNQMELLESAAPLRSELLQIYEDALMAVGGS